MATHDFLHNPEDNEDASFQERFETNCIPKANLAHIFNPEILGSNPDFKSLKRAADQGSPDAQYLMGLCYFQGELVKKSHKLAFKYFKLAEEQGIEQAYFYLGVLYREGIATKQSHERAFHYFKLAERQGDSRSSALLADFYSEGKVVEKDPHEALRGYQLAVENGNPQALILLFDAYTQSALDEVSKEHYQEYFRTWFQYFKERADQGEVSPDIIGQFYEEGIGVEKSFEKAVACYQLSADKNSSTGFLFLGRCYEKGRGVPPSVTKAIYYYRKAGETGLTQSWLILAMLLLKDNQNAEEAVNYLKLIVQKGTDLSLNVLVIAHYYLGTCLEKGCGIIKSMKNALYHYKFAADHGELMSQIRLGDAYYDAELGLKEDFSLSYHYFKLASHQGSPYASRQLLLFNLDGGKTEQSLDKATDFYTFGNENDLEADAMFFKSHVFQQRTISKKPLESIVNETFSNTFLLSHFIENNNMEKFYSFLDLKLSADKGDGEAQYFLGKTYLKGMDGLRKNLENALHYLHLAASQGNLNACKTLFEGYYYGAEFEQSYEKALDYLKPLVNAKVLHYCNHLGVYFDRGLGGINQSFEEAFRLFKDAADRGYDLSQYNTGLYYLYGRGVERSEQNAFNYFRMAANQGMPQAQFNLGKHFQKGIGTEINNEQALKYYKLSAFQGSQEAMQALANDYKYGIDPNKTQEENNIYLKLFKSFENPHFNFKVGVDFRLGKNGLKQSYYEAFRFFKKAADQGYAKAQFSVAEAYRKGQGVEHSYEKALEYYQMAAMQNLPEAKFSIACYFREGLGGLEQSYEKAFKHFKDAADGGYNYGQYNTGLYYLYGKGVERSEQNAFNYFKMAADQGYAAAQYMLAKHYTHAFKAAQIYLYFKSAAEKDDRRAIFELGKCYQLEIGVEKNLAKGHECFLRAEQLGCKEASEYLANTSVLIKEENAAERGNVEAQMRVGKRYQNGWFCNKSIAKACKFYQLAADFGNPKAQFLTAECYRLGGLDFKASFDKALEYYKLAATKGHIEAIKFLMKHYFYSNFDPEALEEALKYVRLGVQQQDPECQYQLGSYYQHGWGNLKQSLSDAMHFYQLSADQGNQNAQRSMQSLKVA